jgi:hypothetical protein
VYILRRKQNLPTKKGPTLLNTTKDLDQTMEIAAKLYAKFDQPTIDKILALVKAMPANSDENALNTIIAELRNNT